MSSFLLELFNYGLVLIYGLFLSAEISGGWKNSRQKLIVFALLPVLLLVQCLVWLLLDLRTVRELYPLIVHLPLVLILVFALKKKVGVALVSVCTAYLLCQLPRCVKLAVAAVSADPLAGELCYSLCIISLFFVLRKWFVRAAHEAMTASPQSLLLFGSLPVIYYFFDYAVAVYPDYLHANLQAMSEFLPTALILFYILFLTAYHTQTRKRTDAELQGAILEASLKQSLQEIDDLRQAEMQTRVYQHDMRHHLTAIAGFLSSGDSQQAELYIKKVQSDVDCLSPKRFCENEIVNLLCASFAGKAEHMGVRLTVKAALPEVRTIPETELCSVLSNGLENALQAAAALPPARRKVSFRCSVRRNKLLIEIQNPYSGEVVLRDGLPVSAREKHGYGCRSMRSIVERNHGQCSFEAASGIFTFRAALPLYDGGDDGEA